MVRHIQGGGLEPSALGLPPEARRMYQIAQECSELRPPGSFGAIDHWRLATSALAVSWMRCWMTLDGVSGSVSRRLRISLASYSSPNSRQTIASSSSFTRSLASSAPHHACNAITLVARYGRA